MQHLAFKATEGKSHFGMTRAVEKLGGHVACGARFFFNSLFYFLYYRFSTLTKPYSFTNALGVTYVYSTLGFRDSQGLRFSSGRERV